MFLLLFIGLILRLVFLDKHAFWFDEAASVSVAKQPLSALFSATAADTHPPFYFLVLKFWSTISSSLLFLRSLSLVFGVFSIIIAYKVFQKLASEKTAFLASILLALSSLNIYYSTEIRMYSLLLLESLLLIWFFLRFTETKKRPFLLAIFLTGSIAVHTHYYAFLVIFSLNIAFFLSQKLRSQSRVWLTYQTLIILSTLPWLLFTLKTHMLGCWCFNPLVGIPATITSFSIGGVGIVTLKDFIITGPKYALWFFTVATASSIVLFLGGLVKTFKKQKTNLLVFFFTPLAVATFIGLFYQAFSPRALIIISPFYYLFVSLGIESTRAGLTQSLSRAIVILLLVGVLTIQFFDPFFSKLPPNKQYLQTEALENSLFE